MADSVSNDGSSDGNRRAIVKSALDTARKSAGKAYMYGGKTTSGFDCSGFVFYVYKNVFADFNYKTASMLASGPWFKVVESPRPGDLIFFPAGQNPYEVNKNNKKIFPDHVGIVIDNDNWIGSQSSTGVAKVSMKSPWWSARPKKFLRYTGLLL